MLKLRPNIFRADSQLFHIQVFVQNITGEMEGQQEPSPTKKAGQDLSRKARVGWDGGPMKNMWKWMLGAAVVAGGLGLGTTAAQAAEFGVYARGPVAYVPPCPGAGYTWQAGYQAHGYWVPGRWAFGGVRDHVDYRVNRTYVDRDHYRSFRDHDGHRYENRGWDRR